MHIFHVVRPCYVILVRFHGRCGGPPTTTLVVGHYCHGSQFLTMVMVHVRTTTQSRFHRTTPRTRANNTPSATFDSILTCPLCWRCWTTTAAAVVVRSAVAATTTHSMMIHRAIIPQHFAIGLAQVPIGHLGHVGHLSVASERELER